MFVVFYLFMDDGGNFRGGSTLKQSSVFGFCVRDVVREIKDRRL